MHTLGQKDKELLIKLDIESLSSVQIRAMKQIHSLLANIATTEEEGEYFDLSAEVLKKVAELIQHANFAVQNNKMSYGTQAIEYAVDNLHETIDDNKTQNLDN